MKVVIQRVISSEVSIGGRVQSQIGHGLLVLVGIEPFDSTEDIDYITRKIIQLRIFNDQQGMMNKSLIDVSGEIMLVSQFTLHASTKKGNRPSYIKAAKPEIAIPIYEELKNSLKNSIGSKLKTGSFGADMKVSLINDGPVTIIIDSKNKE